MKACSGNMISANSKLVMHKDSHTISKLKPKIRIIHIVAPEIIKTDVENFRDLVQRLTGKPAKVSGSTGKGSRVPTAALSSNCSKHWTNMQTQDHRGIQIRQNTQRMKREIRDIYEGESSSGIFGGFGDVDDFIQDLTEYPLLPFKSSQMNMFGEMHLC